MAQLKIVTLGNPNVGKTCLLDRWVSKSYRPNQGPTYHAGFLLKQVDIDGETHTFQLWDTAGQDKFKALTSTYCRNTKGALIVFDKESIDSFEAIPNWITLLRNAGEHDRVPIVIAANKADLGGAVTTEQIAEFCSENGNLPFFETSALTGMNVDGAFEFLCRAAITSTGAVDTDVLPQSVDIGNAAAPPPGEPPVTPNRG